MATCALTRQVSLPQCPGLARDYGGHCMRFDEMPIQKEEQEYVDSIIDAVEVAGFFLGR